MKIMIVDDHADMRRVLRNIISLSYSDKVQMIECESGEEAVRKYGEHTPDCVLMDFELQRMNGFEATQRIYDQDELAMVVIVTSHDTPTIRAKADQLHVHGFVSKENLSAISPILHTIKPLNRQ
jgi:DNA-binding NarL/FixJ family response regulator